MLAFAPSERPAALDVANILSEVARQLNRQNINVWARSVLGSAQGSAPPSVEEVLESPQALGKVFNQTGQYSRRQTASAKGECTAFWSREKITAMLDEGEDQLAASQMFQRRELVQQLQSDPQESVAPVIRSPRVPPVAEYPEDAPWSPDATITGKPDDPDLKAAMDALRVQANKPPPVASPPPAVAPRPVASPVVKGPVASARSPVSPPPVRAPASKPFPWLAVVLGAVAVGMVFVLLAVAGVIYYYTTKEPPPPEAPVAVEEPAPPPVVVEPEPEPKPKTIRKRQKRPAKRAPAPRTQTRRTAPPPAPVASGTYQVTFRSMGAEAKFACGDGQSGRFVGVTRREFTDITTCRITIDDAVGAVQLRQKSVVNCMKAGTAVTCTGA